MLSWNPKKEGQSASARRVETGKEQMKTARFLIIILFSLLIISSINSEAKAQNSGQIKITAYVSEHLTYLMQEDQLKISTNYQAGLIIISQDRTARSSSPAELNLESWASPFSLTVNF